MKTDENGKPSPPQKLRSAGANACPPEDCGALSGYYRLLDVLADPKDPEHEEMKGWVEADWNPEAFDCERVNVDLGRFKA